VGVGGDPVVVTSFSSMKTTQKGLESTSEASVRNSVEFVPTKGKMKTVVPVAPFVCRVLRGAAHSIDRTGDSETAWEIETRYRSLNGDMRVATAKVLTACLLP
jgi:hypothetical protein